MRGSSRMAREVIHLGSRRGLVLDQLATLIEWEPVVEARLKRHLRSREGRAGVAAFGSVQGLADRGLARPVRRPAGRGAGRPGLVPTLLRLGRPRADAGAHELRAVPQGPAGA